ncbi:lysozyme C, milk isozyme-like [Galendromus occidentalis]|uniref:lysozyme n=1 Tax=Galendromus occidentalis TaxID=34638 RepID=A0AAJ6QYB7_9ACAR|nr:lysozyme C, milk isozyme-like [Galendromus occidentalis]
MVLLRLFLIFSYLSIFVTQVAGRKVHRCFVARKLKELTAYKRTWHLKQFLCIVDMVSGFNLTHNVRRQNGQRTVGIFQFPSKWYCVDKAKEDTRAGKCHQLCSAFLDEDLKNDVRCASIAVNQYGFRFWKGWEENCLYRELDHYLEGCAL